MAPTAKKYLSPDKIDLLSWIISFDLSTIQFKKTVILYNILYYIILYYIILYSHICDLYGISLPTNFQCKHSIQKPSSLQFYILRHSFPIQVFYLSFNSASYYRCLLETFDIRWAFLVSDERFSSQMSKYIFDISERTMSLTGFLKIYQQFPTLQNNKGQL